MEAERPDLDRAAREYEDVMRQHLDLDAQGWPRFHLILLGIGADGHTASLFPGSGALKEKKRMAAPATGTMPGPDRVTLTLPALNRAQPVLFLVSGKEKAAVLREILSNGNRKGLPAGLVRPRGGEVRWLIDRDAASLLRTT